MSQTFLLLRILCFLALVALVVTDAAVDKSCSDAAGHCIIDAEIGDETRLLSLSHWRNSVEQPAFERALKAAIEAEAASFNTSAQPLRESSLEMKCLPGYCCPTNRTFWPSQEKLQALSSSLGGTLDASPSTHPGLPDCNLDCPAGVYRNLDMSNMMPEFSVSVTSQKDVELAVKFAVEHNIRVIVKNLGHSYRGESAGHGSMMIYTRALNSLKIKNRYKTCGKTNKALQVGGGVVWGDVYDKLHGTKHSIIGGICRSVSATGGWLQGVGLSEQLSRFYGFGVDNVLQFKIVLPSGKTVVASECKRRDLFKALRGGGGGSWGVIVSVHYKLLPHTEIHRTTLTMPKAISRSAFQVLAKHAVKMDKRFAVELMGHLDNLLGLPSTMIMFTFAGTRRDRANSAFYKDVRSLIEREPFLRSTESSWDNYIDFKQDDFIQIDTATSWRSCFAGHRLIPRSFFNNVNAAAELLYELADSSLSCGGLYHLGGTSFKNWKSNPGATYVHPNLRKAAFMVSFKDPKVSDALLARGPSWAGSSINHQHWDEKNWREHLWTHKDYKQLLKTKKKYDPKNLFHGRRSVGWTGD